MKSKILTPYNLSGFGDVSPKVVLSAGYTRPSNARKEELLSILLRPNDGGYQVEVPTEYGRITTSFDNLVAAAKYWTEVLEIVPFEIFEEVVRQAGITTVPPSTILHVRQRVQEGKGMLTAHDEKILNPKPEVIHRAISIYEKPEEVNSEKETALSTASTRQSNHNLLMIVLGGAVLFGGFLWISNNQSSKSKEK